MTVTVETNATLAPAPAPAAEPAATPASVGWPPVDEQQQTAETTDDAPEAPRREPGSRPPC